MNTLGSNEFVNFFDNFNLNPPASADDVRSFEQSTIQRFPTDYLDFLRTSNGGEGMLGRHYVILWRVEDLVKWNSDYEVEEYVPGLFFIGSNGGGEAYAFDMRSTPPTVVCVPFIGMEFDAVQYIAMDFKSFVRTLTSQV